MNSDLWIEFKKLIEQDKVVATEGSKGQEMFVMYKNKHEFSLKGDELQKNDIKSHQENCEQSIKSRVSLHAIFEEFSNNGVIDTSKLIRVSNGDFIVKNDVES